MWRPVQYQDRAAADGSSKESVRLAGVEDVRISLEDLAYGLRVGQHHELAVPGNVECKRISVMPMALVKQSEGISGEAK